MYVCAFALTCKYVSVCVSVCLRMKVCFFEQTCLQHSHMIFACMVTGSSLV